MTVEGLTKATQMPKTLNEGPGGLAKDLVKAKAEVSRLRDENRGLSEELHDKQVALKKTQQDWETAQVEVERLMQAVAR